MAKAQTNRVDLRYIVESTWGATPATPTMISIPFTSEDLKSAETSVQSETIRSDRNLIDSVRVGGEASGSVNFELTFGDFDDILESLMFSAWVSLDITGTTLSLATATLSDSGSGMGAAVAGMWVNISGSATTANNGLYRVNTAAAGALALFNQDGTTAAFTSDSANASLRVRAKMVRNGTTQKSFTVEKAFTDINQFRQYRGMIPAEFSLDISSRSKINGSFSFTGKGQTSTGTTIASGAVTAIQGNKIINASNHVGRAKIGSLTTVYKSISLAFTNNLRAQDAVANSDAVGVGEGEFGVSGSVSAYFEDSSLIDAFLNETTNKMEFVLTDPDGNDIVITLAAVKFTEEGSPASGKNADVMSDLSFVGIADSGGTYTAQIDMLAV